VIQDMQYNQTGRGQVRVGNWFEELKLKEDTGIRFYPEPSKKESSLLTKSRCIEHSARTDPKEYVSVTHATLRNPKTDSSYQKLDNAGPRYKRFESTVKQEIEEKVQQQTMNAFQESRRVDYESEAKATWSKPGFKASLKENDFTVRVPTRTSNYSTDNALTFYSHAIKENPGQIPFPMTFVKSINPFRKNCVFSADIENEAIAARTETFERPQTLPTVREYRSLIDLRTRLVQHTKNFIAEQTGRVPYAGHTVRYIIDVLSHHQSEEETPVSEIESDIYQNFGQYQLSPAERYALLSAYDNCSKGSISIIDFAALFKRTPSMRRMELIGIFYDMVDPDHAGVVRVDGLRNRLSYRSEHADGFLEFVSNAGTEFTIDDFYDFYIFVSSEIENEEVFENLLKDAWETL
jgi:hypothetical protein